jgi:acetylornithine/N-succinyldiaminopimelate aminotransferase
MNITQVKECDATYIMPTSDREIFLTRGEGTHVWDSEGNRYLDLVAGVAVCNTGHCHPAVVQAIQEQAKTLMHCSNLYYSPHQAILAENLVMLSGMAKVFFTNSGTEAVEAAIKLARVRTRKHAFIACENGFHGRSCGALACTYKPEIREPFEPLQPSCTFVPYGDAQAIREAITTDTAAVILEPVQGQGGVIIPPSSYLADVRKICDETGVLFIIDEIQTGMGRTGAWFAYQHAKIMPDIITLAKGLGSGFPMGAMLAREDLQFERGEHGSTFAGGPIACAAGCATIDALKDVITDVPRKALLFAELLKTHNPRVYGLMIGISAREHCPDIAEYCLKHGVLVNCVAHGNLRLVPPLTISDNEIMEACHVINEAFSSLSIT